MHKHMHRTTRWWALRVTVDTSFRSDSTPPGSSLCTNPPSPLQLTCAQNCTHQPGRYLVDRLGIDGLLRSVKHQIHCLSVIGYICGAMALIYMNMGPVDQADDPPTNQAGEFICGRANRDGSSCHALVPMPYLSCYQHDQGAPVVID